MRLVLLVINLWVVVACQAASDTAAPHAAADAVVSALVNTPYAAKVHDFNVVSRDYQDPKTKEWLRHHTVSADVLNTYRGAEFEFIEFEMYTEIDESLTLDKAAVNIVLCESEQGQLYWPGTGSIFPPTAEIDAMFARSASRVNIYQSYFSWCR
ncbi:hypothetical protein [Shewanella waksmanii]|uniref:hypothetical protein n=1 Tax=Shewanella waksmanii TaxID=213783 RepID=UPI0004AE1187|nr:hypothetical protein [Shewanella waksmanii]